MTEETKPSMIEGGNQKNEAPPRGGVPNEDASAKPSPTSDNNAGNDIGGGNSSANAAAADMENFQLFSTRNPKDAVAGVSSGLKSIGKGVVGGVASLIALPIAGAREEGVLGFAKGLGLGVISAAAMTIGGVGTGVVQIGRGIVNTPAAIKGKMSEQLWDEEKRVWYSYDLPKEVEEVKLMEKESKKAAEASGEGVADMELYHVIGVPHDATSAEIKKAYRVQAIKLHPDKNLDDPSANEKFQKLGEAYQILSNPQLRAAYDSKGKDGIDQDALLDSAHLFDMIFGSQRFESFIGELQLLSLQESLKVVSGDDEKSRFEGMAKAEKQMKFKQKKREVTCALNLSKHLDQYLQDNSDEKVSFRAYVQAEAKELSSTAFGGTLIGVVGYVYEEQALHFLGFKKSVTAGLGLDNVAQSAHVFASKYKVLSSAVKMYGIAREEERKQMRKAQNPNGPQDPQDDLPNPKAVQGLLETLWNYTVVDVEATLRSVCVKVLKDSSVPFEDRVKRAEGLLLLGEIFKAHASTEEAGLNEFGAKMSMGMGASPESPVHE